MNWMKTFLLMTVMTLLLVGLGSLIGGRNGALIALVIAGVMNFISYWWSDKIVLRMYRAKPVGAEDTTGLYDAVRELATQTRIPMPKVYVLPTESPNAFATGRNPDHAAVAATAGILRILDRRELKAVMAHELGHVRNRDILISSVAATLAGAIGYLAFGARLREMFGDRRNGGSSWLVLLGVILAPLAAALIQMAISRNREYAADYTGAHLTHDPEALANALLKLQAGVARAPMGEQAATTAHLFIVNPLSGASLGKLFSTHPPVEERVARLRALVGRV
jgi:heat shock protein HtpX